MLDVAARRLLVGAALLAGCSDASPGAAPDGGAAASRALPADGGAPWRLSQTGLYADIATRRVASGARPYQVAYELWSDGSAKQRWLDLPPGTKIDTRDMDHWSFPVGTRVWKEFRRADLRLETRLVQRTGDGPRDYWMGAFVWTADGTDAVYTPEGADDVHGTEHDVPSEKRCWTCHQGDAGRLLGVSALQLSHDGPGLTLAALIAEGRLSHPPPAGTRFVPPGAPAVRDALGYLHANCAHCHDPNGIARPDVLLYYRVRVGDATAEATATYETNVGVAMKYAPAADVVNRVERGRPEASGLVHRMRIRGTDKQMPPIASERVHEGGVKLIEDWIRAL